MTRVRFTTAANADVERAAAWYEAQSKGLGDKFLDRVAETVERIREHPEVYRKFIQDVRMASVRKFPYGLWFRAQPDGSIVIACLHAKREPSIAKSRALGILDFPNPQ